MGSEPFKPKNGWLTVSCGLSEFNWSHSSLYFCHRLWDPDTGRGFLLVWQEGPVNGNIPGRHPVIGGNARSVGTIDFRTGQIASNGGDFDSRQRKRNVHGILFSLATLQVLALLLRPKPDHKYRLYWNINHWAVGYIYATIGMSVFIVLKGLLHPEIQWWHADTVTAISLGIISAVLEAITWTIVTKRKKANKEKQNQRTNGVNGANGHAARTV